MVENTSEPSSLGIFSSTDFSDCFRAMLRGLREADRTERQVAPTRAAVDNWLQQLDVCRKQQQQSQEQQQQPQPQSQQPQTPASDEWKQFAMRGLNTSLSEPWHTQ